MTQPLYYFASQDRADADSPLCSIVFLCCIDIVSLVIYQVKHFLSWNYHFSSSKFPLNHLRFNSIDNKVDNISFLGFEAKTIEKDESFTCFLSNFN